MPRRYTITSHCQDHRLRPREVATIVGGVRTMRGPGDDGRPRRGRGPDGPRPLEVTYRPANPTNGPPGPVGGRSVQVVGHPTDEGRPDAPRRSLGLAGGTPATIGAARRPTNWGRAPADDRGRRADRTPRPAHPPDEHASWGHRALGDGRSAGVNQPSRPALPFDPCAAAARAPSTTRAPPRRLVPAGTRRHPWPFWRRNSPTRRPACPGAPCRSRSGTTTSSADAGSRRRRAPIRSI